jgi:hypothetical protein
MGTNFYILIVGFLEMKGVFCDEILKKYVEFFWSLFKGSSFQRKIYEHSAFEEFITET